MSENTQVLPFASADVGWRCPIAERPPLGRNIWILTNQGVAIKGMWIDGMDYIGWSPLPKIPAYIKVRVGVKQKDWSKLYD